MSTTIELPFSHEECVEAYEAWGCNCGPTALAAILNRPLDSIRRAVEAAGFSRRRNYLSPTMMAGALRSLGARWDAREVGALTRRSDLAFPDHGLARIQWEGPWTQPGANPKWSYRFTHWVSSWKRHDGSAAGAVLAQLGPVVFDVNGGLMDYGEWEEEIVPLITKSIPRADGDWHVTHCWEVEA